MINKKMKLKMFNKIKINSRIKLLLTSGGFTYSLIKGLVGFYKGYHNLDIAFNFLNLGLKIDMNTAGQFVKLSDYYIIGLNQMEAGAGWLCLAVLLAILFGYFVRGVKK